MSWCFWPPKAKGCRPSAISASLLFQRLFVKLFSHVFSNTARVRLPQWNSFRSPNFRIFQHIFSIFHHRTSLQYLSAFILRLIFLHNICIFFTFIFILIFFHIFSKGARRPTTHFRGQYSVDTMKLWVAPCSSFSCRHQVLWFFV